MSPLLNRMLARAAAAVAPPSTPKDFTATLQCPSGHVLLEWDNDGRSESKVLEYSTTGTGGWTQIATPAAGDSSYLHQNPPLDPEQTIGYWRIRWASESAWATTSEFVICPE